jgi:hypothetical protein
VKAWLAAALTLPLMVTVGAAAQTAAARCEPDGPPVVLQGSVGRDRERTYELHPVEVVPGVGRIEVSYGWEPADGGTIDLGLWDGDGDRSPAGFRGWSGSRQGRSADQPVYVEELAAERGYRPGPVEPGLWNLELGYAAVNSDGPLRWTVTVRCLATPAGPPALPAGSVDPAHVARPGPSWFTGDFHMHGRHSSPDGPDWDTFVARARAGGLDFAAVTEYVTNAHWDELGPVQARHPDLLIWPGREIITYFGHAIALGETPSTVEYRHGFGNVTLARIQQDVRGDGALFGIAHPAIREAALPPGFCRGCEFTLDDEIDWDAVDTFEVWTEERFQRDPRTGQSVVNPFNQMAIDEWYALLNQGHRLTAVGGSDDKSGAHYGVPATAVYARELSRTALVDAVRGGHAYVRTLGATASPSLEFQATTSYGQTAIFGDRLATDSAAATVVVKGGTGQTLRILRNGAEVERLAIPGDEFTHQFVAGRADGEGPLGTFWNVETVDHIGPTTVGNPIFLTGAT